MTGECDTMAPAVVLEPEQRRALGILRENGLMTVAAFAAVMWMADPDAKAAEQLLNDLCRAGMVEPVLRPVGPLRFALTVKGLDNAWT
ncbi:MAG TPA: hypothetical protein PLC79_07420 [Phycisphaerae bacterium]|nr:hypothetical protein [Phycisphaerae bacterium]